MTFSMSRNCSRSTSITAGVMAGVLSDWTMIIGAWRISLLTFTVSPLGEGVDLTVGDVVRFVPA